MQGASDTIAAIATAPGDGAISIIRISGPEAFAIADRLLACKGARPSERSSHTFVHAFVATGGGERSRLDEVIALVYRAPRSYTREDCIEIQGHGGTVAARRILRAVLDAGARPAEPGEFTQRAFLNGRVDLVQAEAVQDLIRARSDRAADAAMEQLAGGLSRDVNGIYDEIIGVAADIEATLDFAEDDLPDGVLDALPQRLAGLQARVSRLLDTWEEGHRLREGLTLAIVGRPNVGKSTLLNALLGKDRAIVAPMPGTTRDIVEESWVVDGMAIRICDTAGIRQTECQIEGEGIRRAIALSRRADGVIYVVDASEARCPEDDEQLSRLDPGKTVIFLNKCDRTVRCGAAAFRGWDVVDGSAFTTRGIDNLKSAVSAKMVAFPGAVPHASISERHRQLLKLCQAGLEDALRQIACPAPDLVVAVSGLRAALEPLGQITGRVYHDALLSSIFSKFCIGK